MINHGAVIVNRFLQFDLVTEDSGEEFIDEDLTENSTQLDITKVKMEPTIPVGENEPSSNERK